MGVVKKKKPGTEKVLVGTWLMSSRREVGLVIDVYDGLCLAV